MYRRWFMFNSNWRTTCALAMVFLVSGCASLPLQEGRSNIDAMLQARAVSPQAGAAYANASADSQQVDAQIAQWLSAPLTFESAQRIALLRNPRIRMEYARLGLTAADVFEAGRLQNPTFGLSWLLPVGQAQGVKLGA